MMSILEYAADVKKSVGYIMTLCERLNIKHDSENDMLTEDDIILLDGEIENGVDEEALREIEQDEALDEKVEQMLGVEKLEMGSAKGKEKVKSKSDRVENNKMKFQKERKELYKHREKLKTNDKTEEENVLLYKENMTVSQLAEALKVTSTEIIKKLMRLGIMANINYPLSYEIVEIVALDYDKEVKKEESSDISNFEKYEVNDKKEDLEDRPPIVTVMGHVDHGKTSLLDRIRQTDVVSGEAGGITQAIGAYQTVCNGKKITFIDTPGHEAFTEMRARGASITDIVIIIVAADDGVKPQTKEAIDHAKAAKVPIIVAINKIDKKEANVERVMTELSEYGLTPEAWGGDTIFNNISCKTGEGIDKLLENIILLSEMAELKANPSRYAIGTVIESKLDKKTGVIASLLVQNGTLRLGDPVVVGTACGKIRSLKDDKGRDLTEAQPSMPVEITGISEVPQAGDRFMAFENEKQARSVAERRKLRAKAKDTNRTGMTLDDLFGAIQEGVKEISVVLKTDVNGSLEAIKQSLAKINVDGAKVTVIRGGVGTITESDVVLAHASNAIIIGFNVRPSASVIDSAKEYNVEIKLYDIIYKMIEDIENAMKGLLDPVYEEVVTGEVEVRQLFKFSKIGTIAGSYVKSGSVKNGANVRVIRDGIVIANTKIKSLQREKDQVKEVAKGMECGITLENYQDIRENDNLEIYELREIKR